MNWTDDFKPDRFWDRKEGFSRRCYKHKCLKDAYGDCPYCLSGIDPLGEKEGEDGRLEK
jgi:hypothetical protein